MPHNADYVVFFIHSALQVQAYAFAVGGFLHFLLYRLLSCLHLNVRGCLQVLQYPFVCRRMFLRIDVLNCAEIPSPVTHLHLRTSFSLISISLFTLTHDLITLLCLYISTTSTSKNSWQVYIYNMKSKWLCKSL